MMRLTRVSRPVHCDASHKTKKQVQGSPRLVALNNKANKIREMVVATTDVFDRDELMSSLAKVRGDIQKIESDPLTHDFCKDNPSATECKVYDF